MSSKILITGGTGFAGSHLVEALVDRGESDIHVTTYDLRETFVTSILKPENIHKIDLSDKNQTFSLIENLQPDQIYHLASISSVDKSFDDIKRILDINSAIQLNLFEAVRKYCPNSKILAIGSALEYDTLSLNPTQKIDEDFQLGPNSPYALSKITQDMMAYLYCHTYKLQIIRVRPFNHIGERQTLGFVVADFANQIAMIERGEETEIRVGNLEAIRDFSDVKDISQGYILLMEKGKIGSVYNLGSGVGYKIQEILDLLVKKATCEIQVVVDPNKFRPLDVESVIADNENIKSLGWQPQIKLEDTLDRIINYYRKIA